MKTHWRAPGKLMVLGEYAVLDGSGAIVAAVDHGVDCIRSDGPLSWTTPGDDRFVAAALEGADGHYSFLDWKPVDLKGEKPGFGGSAAATVAALLARGEPEAAYEIHRRVQGSGSGVDVFASLNGGVRRFPDGKAVKMPPFAVVWSGRSASTGPRVRQYQSWGGRRPFVEAMRALVDGFETAPVAAAREGAELLRAMAQASGVAYETPEHTAITQLAARFGGAGKPSGAGGGDIAVAVFPDEGARAAFTGFCTASGLQVIPCMIAEPAGLHRLVGERVQLAPFTPERLAMALGDRAGLARSLGVRIPGSWPQPDYAPVLRVLAGRWRTDPGEAEWQWLVIREGELVGEIAGKVGPQQGALEFGYGIVPEHRGHGLATDAARTFADWAFGQPGVLRLTAECTADNLASQTVLFNAGLTQVGERREGGQRILRWVREA